ncbi:helix-turn-helix domain-containing protein [Bacillus toyonensis]
MVRNFATEPEWQSIFTIAEMCSIFNISRATYYRWKNQEKIQRIISS